MKNLSPSGLREVLHLALPIILTMGLTFIGALRGAGDTHWIAGATVALLLTAFAPLSLGAIAFTNLKSLGPWLGGTVYIILLGLVMWWRFARRKWQEINIFATATEYQAEQIAAE
jgi:Na+-driven multidrug efflux pump